jgi:purine-binding chemotaxis protein CheW
VIRQRRRRGAPIDWAAVRERLARAVAATEAAHDLTPEQARAVLEERARRLARPPQLAPRPGETLELLGFSLGRERYAIEARFVREVMPLRDYTPVPGAPEVFVGVTNLRGDVLAIADLRKLLHIDENDLSDLSRVIVVGGDEAELGILADAVHAVEVHATAAVLDPPGWMAGAAREVVRGVTREALVVIAGDRLLADARLVVA